MMFPRPLYVMTLSLLLVGCLDDTKPVESSGEQLTLGQSYQESRPVDEERGFNQVDPNYPALEAVGLPPLNQSTADMAYQITANAVSGCTVSKTTAPATRSKKNKANWGVKEGATVERLAITTEVGGKHGLRDLRKKRAEWDSTVIAISAKHGMDPNLIHGIISTESAYIPNAGSNKGAMGMMQLLRGTGKQYGLITDEDFFNATKNINGGTQYFKWLLGVFKGNLSLAIASYNAGPGPAMWCGNNIPPYNETRKYVSRVTGYAEFYRKNR